MLMWFRFIGITDVTVIKVEQTLSETEAGAGALNHAFQEAGIAASSFN
jgi:FMN-dependent NADH-azoreductase